MKKRVLALFLLVGMIFLSACGGTDTLDLSLLSPETLKAPVPASSTEDVYAALTAIAPVSESSEQLDEVNVSDPLETPDQHQVLIAGENSAACLQGEYLYVLSNADFKILKLLNGKLSLLASVGITDPSESNSESYQFSNALFVSGDKLAVITSSSSFTEVNGAFIASERTYAKIYDITNPSAPEQLGVLSQDGSYQDSALVGDTLYLISNHIADLTKTENAGFLPLVNDNGADIAIPAERVYLTDSPVDAAYCVVSSIHLNEATRKDACAFIGSCTTTDISDGGVYLAHIVRRNIDSEPYDEDQYRVTGHASASLTQLIQIPVQPALSPSGSYGLRGEAIALDCSGDLILVAAGINEASYRIFTDETYGWSNRLEDSKEESTIALALSHSFELVGKYEANIPAAEIGVVYFNDGYCYFMNNGAETPLLRVDFTSPDTPVPSDIERIDGASSHFLFGPSGILSLTVQDKTETRKELLLSLHSKETLDPAAEGAFSLDITSNGTIIAANSEDGKTALIAFGGEAHLLQIGDKIRELGMPKIGVHSGTNFIFDSQHLYACAPDAIFIVDLQTAETLDALSFGVG